MFEQSARWNEYYRELDPGKRRAILETLCASEPDDGANACRRLLFEARHTDPRDPKRQVDRMLFMCVNFLQLCQSSRLFRGFAVKEVERTLKELRCAEAEACGEAGERALYWEMRNAVARYLSTCESPSYNRSLFGLAPSRDENRQERILQDIWRMSAGLAHRIGLEEKLRLWNQAVLDAYCLTGDSARARFDAYNRKMLKA